MKSRRSGVSPDRGAAVSKWLSLALATLLFVPPVGFAKPRVAAPVSGARAAEAPRAQVFGYLFTVNTTGDADRVASGLSCDTDASTPGDQCTLRSAIQAANANPSEAGIDIIIPPTDPGCDASAGRCTITVTRSLPQLTSNADINGPGANKLTVRLRPGESGSIFRVSGAVVGLYGMTITGAFISGLAGGAAVINADGGTLNIFGCAISDNRATGISNSYGTVNVTNSTISRNRSDFAGGIFNRAGLLNITNSTIISNVGRDGGGLDNAADNGVPSTANVTNCTFTDNFAIDFGDAIINRGGAPNVVNVKSSIIALNGNQDVYGNVVSYGYNLVGSTVSTPQGFTHPTDQVGNEFSPLDPKLDPDGLKDNGGPVKTIALLPGSPAIDAGTSDGLTGALTTDQRGTGFPRIVDDPSAANAADGADVGAFESRPTSILQFSSAAYAVSEGTASAIITVKRTGSLAGTVTVNYFTSDGTAKAGQDYTAPCGTLTFTANQASKTFTIPITGDALDEPNETVNLGLVNPTGSARLGAPSTAVLTINDNDLPPKLSINNATVTEGDSGSLNATVTVTLSPASIQTVTVNYATADGTAKAPGDYAAKTGTLSFSPGQTTKTLTVAVRGDVLDEANETFVVNLSSPAGATVADAQGLCTITDNDPVPGLTINNVSVTEPDSGTVNVTLTVTLSAASGRNISVSYATANGTANSSTDYVAKAGTLSFAAGQTTRTVVVQVRGDTLKEANETLFVNLSGAVNATIADTQGQVTILNDD